MRLLGQGWDNTAWLVDDSWVFRFPRRSMVIPGLENEIAYLPRLATILPLPIPDPEFVGEPSEDFEWPFFGARFLPGRELAEADLDGTARDALAHPLAEFLRTLHAVELDGDLPVDPVRRTEMGFRVPMARKRLVQVEELGLWRTPPVVHELLADAEALPPAEASATCHGDLHLRHLLVDDADRPTGVIDWIDLSRNDPAVDLILFWSALTPAGRAEFLDAYGPISEEQLLRSRALTLYICAVLAAYGHLEDLPWLEREAVSALDRVMRTA